MIAARDTIAEIRDLLECFGAQRYGTERVSQLEHALQCATLAQRDNAGTHFVAAALLHDFGHLLYAAKRCEPVLSDAQHDQIGARYLAGKLPPSVVEPIRLHVEAKRYLCATDPSYAAQLSPASRHSLRLQGGAHSAQQARLFLQQPYAAAALRLRRWDEAAKVPGAATLTLSGLLAQVGQLAA